MSTHNICFYGEIKKNITWTPHLICGHVSSHLTYTKTDLCLKAKPVLITIIKPKKLPVSRKIDKIIASLCYKHSN